MALLAEYAITPDVFDAASYSTADECSARIEVIRDALLTEGLVRDLRSGSWSSLFNPDGRRQAPRVETRDWPSRRTWHPRGARLVKTLSTEQRLVKWPPMRPEPPTDDAGWCVEALATHAKASPYRWRNRDEGREGQLPCRTDRGSNRPPVERALVEGHAELVSKARSHECRLRNAPRPSATLLELAHVHRSAPGSNKAGIRLFWSVAPARRRPDKGTIA